ncbi:methyltransferase, putative [Bodo saltans]|uniref:protein-histidine N-methyltransferase n=1 Tax=Bodo saltans TaxID=75058 RepID=A0A0S4JZQ6_BODSA|nr:methyltransferase, putative [Bodo saltans]|eukprot:CUG94068.1 methyltransferase, putative [Bodo saltans]
MNEDTAEGFVFDFGGPSEEIPVAACSSNAPLEAANAVPNWLGPFVCAADVVRMWSSAYPTAVPRQLALQLSEGATVLYQTAARVAALEGDGKDSRDIVPGKYYGGLKVWSCAPDLATYVHSHLELVAGKRVVEVGCGQAVPLIAAALSGAIAVTGHDYNQEVIDICTLPNLAASLALRPDVQCSIQTGYGDWETSFLEGGAGAFDVIIGSDVTFDPTACTKLAALLARLLPHDGIALIATKQYYFGTNGGLGEFEEAVQKSANGQLTVQRVLRLGDGNEMQRHIVLVSWKR